MYSYKSAKIKKKVLSIHIFNKAKECAIILLPLKKSSDSKNIF
jgi:hypothetical protein